MFFTSMLRLLSEVFGSILRFGWQGRSVRLHRMLCRVERAVECLLFLKAVALHPTPARKRRAPTSRLWAFGAQGRRFAPPEGGTYRRTTKHRPARLFSVAEAPYPRQKANALAGGGGGGSHHGAYRSARASTHVLASFSWKEGAAPTRPPLSGLLVPPAAAPTPPPAPPPPPPRPGGGFLRPAPSLTAPPGENADAAPRSLRNPAHRHGLG
ncbi:MAG: hypothetical protein IPG56_02395 [Caulobacteraceae bacterium]|nr:hypothetical protein [Caulobacteraceae bacterium]